MPMIKVIYEGMTIARPLFHTRSMLNVASRFMLALIAESQLLAILNGFYSA